MTDLYNSRLKNFEDTINFREPDRVPLHTELMTYPFWYGGTTYQNVMKDPVAALEAYKRFLDDVSFDVALAVTPSFPVRAFHALGLSNYVLASDGCVIQHNQINDHYMEVEDYKKLIKAPAGFRFQFVQQHIPAFCDEDPERAYAKYLEALEEYKTFMAVDQAITNEVFNNRSVVNVFGLGGPYFESAFTIIFNSYRGIRNSLIDLRRCPELVLEACDAIYEQTYKGVVIDPEQYRGKLAVGATGYHPECFLSPKWYDKIFFNKFKELYGGCMEAGLKFFLKGEGSFLNTIDRFRDLPKGAMIVQVDQDGQDDIYRAIGDWDTLIMGVHVGDLNGDKNALLRNVQYCFDTYAPGGGFIFGMDKPLISAKDCPRDTIREMYGLANELAGRH